MYNKGDILDQIVANKRREVEQFKHELPFADLQCLVEPKLEQPVPSMKEALLSSTSGIISEFKRKSPSKGWIKEDGLAAEIPLSYQYGGASAISILTDWDYFGGRDSFIVQARTSGVTIPILYKNFVIDEYQLWQARLCGASAVLLIAADLTLPQCRDLMYKAHQLGMEVLLEMHGEDELEYAALGPDMYGINNRNLGTFITRVENSYRMAEHLPQGECWVSESGISNPDTVSSLRKAGYRGFLIGENFMKTDNPGESLADFISRIQH